MLVGLGAFKGFGRYVVEIAFLNLPVTGSLVTAVDCLFFWIPDGMVKVGSARVVVLDAGPLDRLKSRCVVAAAGSPLEKIMERTR